MAELQKALLQEVEANENQNPIGAPVPVQFNPTSLQLKLSNQSDGGRSRGRQRRQNNGQSSTVLSMELIFDTADEGTDTAPVSVRTKTREVERFVLPKEDGGETPPRLQFQWDKLIIAGIVENLDIDFDHFAENGAPLRAKVRLSIKEQEPKYTASKEDKGSAAATAPGANNTATNPGGGTNQPGGSKKSSDRSAAALDGETAPDFLARQGLDPAAWRGLDIDLSAGLSLQAGIEVGFSAGLNVSAGVGVALGVQASAGVSLEASLGLTAAASLGAQSATGASSGASALTSASKKVNGDSAGQALSAAGGVQAAIATVKMQQVGSAAAASQSAFGLAASSSASQAGGGAKKTSSAASSGSSKAGSNRGGSSGSAGVSGGSVTAGVAPSSGLQLPALDQRATSYGFGVPLRPTYASALTQSSISLCTRESSQNRRADGGPRFAQQKTTPPWIALPQRHSGRQLADSSERNKNRHPCDYSYHPCDCKGD